MATNKQAGKKSLAQNDFLAPLAVTSISATNVGTNRPYLATGNGTAGQGGAVNLSWTLPSGSPAVSVYQITTTPATATKTTSSTSYTFEGLASATSYTFTIIGYNDANAGTPATSSSVIVTTVPETPAQPTATSPGAGYDRITWTAPNNGGSVITNYYVAGNDGTSGNTSNTTIDISQGMGETQAYTVYATNANGNSGTSSLSGNITTTFSFAPFGFSPFAFAPFSFAPFNAFSFAPFGFVQFSFAPFGAFSFKPFGFVCVGEDAEIMTIREGNLIALVSAKDLKVGDRVISPTWYGYDANENVEHSRVEYPIFVDHKVQDGIVLEILKSTEEKIVYINNDKKKAFTQTHPILAKVKGGNVAWEKVMDLAVGDEFVEYNPESEKFIFTTINNLEIDYTEQDVYLISVDSTDTFIASGIISHK
jgi:hypothetical protein